MSHSSDSSTPRRDFLGQMAVSALALAGTACAAPAAAIQTASTAPTPAAPSGGRQAQSWDDSWTTRLTAKHKAVFDSPDVEENTTLGLLQGQRYIQGMRDALNAGPNDVQLVLVVRHKSIPFAFNDAMWEKYKIGEEIKVKQGDAWATKNPGAHARAGNTTGDRPQSNFEWLLSHGNIVLGCDLATQGFATTLAQKYNSTMQVVYQELKANLVPGLILQPNGIYATLRAQEVGCHYFRST